MQDHSEAGSPSEAKPREPEEQVTRYPAAAVPAAPQLYLLPEVTATSAQSRTRPRDPMGTGTATSPREPHTISLSPRARSFPKGPGSAWINASNPGLVGEAGRGLPEQRPSQSEASDKPQRSPWERGGGGGF